MLPDQLPFRLLTEDFAYYHEARSHLSLDRNAPIPRQVEPPSQGRIIAIPHLGGLLVCGQRTIAIV